MQRLALIVAQLQRIGEDLLGDGPTAEEVHAERLRLLNEHVGIHGGTGTNRSDRQAGVF